jgi:cysteinyl-tRNA synthetase
MFPFFLSTTDPTKDAQPPVLLCNTLSRTKERFVPLKKGHVTMYHCGPTVYDNVHIGNLRSYVFADILRKTMEFNGYTVKQVVNITDIGHLTSDADEGEDKMQVGLKREGLPNTLEGLRTLATRYTERFLEDLDALHISRPHVLPKASEHIHGDIALIETLMQKEIAYETRDGVYFDITRFREYGKLGGIDIDTLRAGSRISLDTEKRNPADFALWKKSTDSTIGWESPWGTGFPGWHIECSVMAMQHLGKQIDIHTGGVDHIGTHHNNEIAQSEAATGKQFARYWMHNEFIRLSGEKISKSLKNTIHLQQLVEHGYSPLAYRYWLLTSHYRTPTNFTFQALDAAQTALKRLHTTFVETLLRKKKGVAPHAEYLLAFQQAINNDLDTPAAIALVWKLLKDTQVQPEVVRATLLRFDDVLSLGLRTCTTAPAKKLPVQPHIPQEVHALLTARNEARAVKDWGTADTLRDEIREKGYDIVDSGGESTLHPAS